MRAPPPPLPRRPGSVEPTGGLVVAGKFLLQRLLRKGGMGSVWVATHLGLEVPVAIKFMASTGLSAEARARFAREAKAAAQIRSTNVVQILDYGIDGGLPYIVMELLEGEDLGTRLRRLQRMPLFDVVRVLGPVARALELAHSRGLVHRDLKPENVFLAREGDVEVPKILDFGIAKMTRVEGDDPSDGSTREGAIVGTPYFMSPEQARGRVDIDHRSDLWSLGVIAFRALVGQKPFTSNSMPDVIVKICADPIPRASAIWPDLPAAIDLFFDRALARDPNMRFQSARELHAALAALLPPAALADPALHAAMQAASPGAIPQATGSWPTGAGPGHPTPAPWGQMTPPPGSASSPSYSTGPSGASWPSQPSWHNTGPGPGPMQSGVTLGHGTAATRPPVPTKTPWALLGVLAVVAAGCVTAGILAFLQSRSPSQAPTSAASTSATAVAAASPSTTASPTTTTTSMPEAPSASASSDSDRPISSATASAAPAGPRKPTATTAATARPQGKPASTRDLGY